VAHYDVWQSPDGAELLLEVQANVLSEYSSRVVVPLVPRTEHRPASRLNPVFSIGEREWTLYTQYIAAVPVRILKHRVANVTREHDRIVAALDFLFTGV